MAVLGQHLGHNLLLGGGLIEGNDVIGHLVHQMNRAAVNIQDNVVAIELVLMDHICFLTSVE